MACNKLWGLGIAVLNVMYSFAYLGTSCSDLYTADEHDVMPWVWIVLYTSNAALNTYLFLRMLKRDLTAIMIWFVFTGGIFFMRCFIIDYDALTPKYRGLMIAVNIYISISFLIMLLLVVREYMSKAEKENAKNPPRLPWESVNRTGKTLSTAVHRGINSNRHETSSFIRQPVLNTERSVRNDDLMSDAITVGYITSNNLNHHHNTDVNCCDNTNNDNTDTGCCVDDGGCEGGGGNDGCCDDGGGCEGGGDAGGGGGGGCDDGGGCDGGGGNDGGCDDGGGGDCGGTDD